MATISCVPAVGADRERSHCLLEFCFSRAKDLPSIGVKPCICRRESVPRASERVDQHWV
jgi:hypothetical protein